MNIPMIVCVSIALVALSTQTTLLTMRVRSLEKTVAAQGNATLRLKEINAVMRKIVVQAVLGGGPELETLLAEETPPTKPELLN